MSSTLKTTTPMPTGAGAGASPSRLLDRDPSKFRSFKKVIVVGRPGAGTDAIAKALRILKFKVYDFKAASDRYVRDFPLWVEAARLRSEGKPYNKSDYDKLIGDHDALVGAPTSFFDHGLVQLYPEAKVIMVTREPDADVVNTLLQQLNKFAIKQMSMCPTDNAFFGNMQSFLDFACKAKLDHQTIRETVSANNLLEIDNFDDWKPLCDFLSVRIPSVSVPPMFDNMVASELAARPLHVLNDMKTIHGMKVVRALQHMCGSAGIYVTANMLIKDSRAAAATGFGFAAAFTAWYWTGLPAPKVLRPAPAVAAAPLPPPATTIKGTTTKGQQKPNPSRRQNNRGNQFSQGRGQQRTTKPKATAPRAVRPALAGWGNIEEVIKKDDAALYLEGKERAKEMEGKEITLNTIYSETMSD